MHIPSSRPFARLAGLFLVAGLAAFGTHAFAAGEPVRIGAIFDKTGGLNIYGIQQSRALRLAVDEINAAGGVAGARVEVAEADAQSEDAKYTQYTTTLILKDKVQALFAGLTSSSREAIRPIVRRSKIPYFYSSLYEGGACDRQTFVTGATASQQLSVLVKWAIKKYGPKVYIMAPDYNFGTISAQWVRLYAKEFGGEVVGADFLPLTLTDYSPTINKIQQARPDFVVALPVGANQTGFLEQMAAAGLKSRVGVVSTNYGGGNQQVVVSPQAGEGIVAALEYFAWLDTPRNKAFKASWEKAYGNKEPVTAVAVDVYNAVHLWAKAANKAKSAEPAKVIQAFEEGEGVAFDSPAGPVSMQPKSHHVRQNIYIGVGTKTQSFDIVETYASVAPKFEDQVCDLVAKPQTAQHFTPGASN